MDIGITEIVAVGGLCVALVSLLRPEIYKLYNKLFHKPEIDIIKIGDLEVGYSGFGPTLSARCTLQAVNSDIFISDARLTLNKQKDNSFYRLDWMYFRDDKVDYINQVPHEIGSLTFPRGINLKQHKAEFINILFSDGKVRDEIQVELKRVKQAWFETRIKAQEEGILPFETGGAEPPVDFGLTLETLYNHFSLEKVHSNASQKMNRIFYWEEGRYSLKLEIFTSRPSNVFSKEWAFKLNREEAENLRLNIASLLRESCGLLQIPLFFAYPKYNDD